MTLCFFPKKFVHVYSRLDGDISSNFRQSDIQTSCQRVSNIAVLTCHDCSTNNTATKLNRKLVSLTLHRILYKQTIRIIDPPQNEDFQSCFCNSKYV